VSAAAFVVQVVQAIVPVVVIVPPVIGEVVAILVTVPVPPLTAVDVTLIWHVTVGDDPPVSVAGMHPRNRYELALATVLVAPVVVEVVSSCVHVTPSSDPEKLTVRDAGVPVVMTCQV